MKRKLILLTISTSFLVSGCAEGPLWRAGKFTPWATQQWAAEEQIAETLIANKRKMSESVARVAGGPTENQQEVAQQLQRVVHSDPVLLLRLHAVKLVGDLHCPAAVQTLSDASRDSNSDVRIAAVRAWEKMPAEVAVLNLQDVMGSDTDIDVRLAATRALSKFPGRQAVEALSLALDDRNPALQLRATESLQLVTGEPIGPDVGAWQSYIAQSQNQSRLPAESTLDNAGRTAIADQSTLSNELKR